MKKQMILLTGILMVAEPGFAQKRNPTGAVNKTESTILVAATDKPVANAEEATAPAGAPSTSGASAASNTSVATSSVGAVDSTAVAPSVKYLGFLYGPGLEFSGSNQAVNNSNDSFMLHSRPKFLIKRGANFEAGIETRFDTKFLPGGMKASNNNYRLLANFKNVFKTDTLSVGFMPRILLPTSNKSHDQKMRPSPELIASFDFAPKNTRFSLSGGMAFMAGLYSDDSAPNATTFLYQPWLEVDYQLSPTVQLMTAYWPEFTAQAHSNRPLAGDSHEIDVGVNWDFIKGWTLIPYVALEAYSLADVSSPLQNMQANLIVTGTVF